MLRLGCATAALQASGGPAWKRRAMQAINHRLKMSKNQADQPMLARST